MNLDPVWWPLGRHHGVLELAHGLELHLLSTPVGTRAWWLLDTGRWLGEALVAQC
jgi:hypothetical protein